MGARYGNWEANAGTLLKRPIRKDGSLDILKEELREIELSYQIEVALVKYEIDKQSPIKCFTCKSTYVTYLKCHISKLLCPSCTRKLEEPIELW